MPKPRSLPVIKHVDIVSGDPAALREASRPEGYEPMTTFDPMREELSVWDALNHEELAWDPSWAKDYEPLETTHDGVNNFDGLLLTGWKAASTSPAREKAARR